MNIHDLKQLTGFLVLIVDDNKIKLVIFTI